MEILGHYKFISLCGYVTAMVCFGLAALVLNANPRSRSCQLTFIFNLFVALWSFFYATMYYTTNDEWGLLVNYILTFAAIMLSTVYTHLVLVVLKRNKQHKNLIRMDYVAASLINLILVTTRWIVSGSVPKLDLPSYTDGGILYFLVPLHLFVNVIYSFTQLTRGIKQSRSYRRNQLFLFLLGTIVGFGSATPAFLLVYNIPVKPVTTPLVILYPLLVGYAIVRHRFLDIQKLIKNTLVFTSLFVLLLGCVSAVLLVFKELMSRWGGISDSMAQAIAIALAIGFYEPLKNGLSRITNRMLFQQSYHPEVIFRRLSEDILHSLDLEKLSSEVVTRTAEILALDKIAFYSRSAKSPYLFEMRSCIGKFRKREIPQNSQLIRYLEYKNDFLINSYTHAEARLYLKDSHVTLKNAREIKKAAAMNLALMGGIAAFPVFSNGNLRAFLIAGNKKSDLPWLTEEFSILKSFVRYLSLAFGNAEYVQAIHHSRIQLASRERDASAGALIAGIDHEVKGPVQSILLAAEVLKKHTELWRSGLIPRMELIRILARKMEQIREDTEKMSRTMQELTDLAENKTIRIEKNVKPEEIVRGVLHELSSSLDKHHVEIQLEIEECLAFPCSPNALYEILINLIRNACQAITTKGKISIRGSRDEEHVLLEVEDTGIGIPGERLQHIFEPYYTTKKSRQKDGSIGSGMGLFIVKEYMREMGGHVEVASTVDQGTLFRLRFPNSQGILKEAA